MRKQSTKDDSRCLIGNWAHFIFLTHLLDFVIFDYGVVLYCITRKLKRRRLSYAITTQVNFVLVLVFTFSQLRFNLFHKNDNA